MKQLIFFTAIILISCVIVSAVIIPANAQQGNLEQIIEAIEDEDNLYLLKSNNGTLCVYLKQTGELIMNTETSVSVLPKEDQKLLEKGIEVKDEEQLYQALEDYCS